MPSTRNSRRTPPEGPTLLPHLTRASFARCYGYWLVAQHAADVVLDRFPFEPESTANIRLGNVHETARKTKSYRDAGRIAGRQLFGRIDPSRDIGVILLTRLIPRGGRMRDTDNRESSYKPFRDGLASGLGLKDDGPSSGIEWIVDEAKFAGFDSPLGQTRVSIWHANSELRQQFEAWCTALATVAPGPGVVIAADACSAPVAG